MKPSIAHRLTWLAVVIALVIPGCKQKTEQTPSQSETYRVGAIIPLTGPGAALGTLIKRGLDLGVEDANARPGAKRIEIVFEDSKTNPTQGLTAFRKLVDVDNTKVVLVAFSAVCNATAPAAEESDVLMVGMTTSMPGLVENRQHVIRLFMTADMAASTIAHYCSPRFARMGVMYSDDEYGKATYGAFRTQFVSGDRTIVFAEPFKPTDKDFRTSISKMLDANPAAIFLPGYGPGYIALINQIRERSPLVPIVADSPLTNPTVYKAAGDAVEGVVVPGIALDAGLPDTLAQKSFLERYLSRYNENPSINVTINYDFVQLLTNALATTDGSPQAIRIYFISQKAYQGVTGKIEYLSNGDSLVQVRPMKIQGGTIIPLKD